MSAAKASLFGLLQRFAGHLRFPQLFWITLILFVVDLIVPDMIPFADEVLLGLATLLLGSWKRRKDTARKPESTGPVIDVTPGPDPEA
jgi:hypothetical protein